VLGDAIFDRRNSTHTHWCQQEKATEIGEILKILEGAAERFPELASSLNHALGDSFNKHVQQHQAKLQAAELSTNMKREAEQKHSAAAEEKQASISSVQQQMKEVRPSY
jgi:Sec-independent protein translocase protein TatA